MINCHCFIPLLALQIVLFRAGFSAQNMKTKEQGGRNAWIWNVFLLKYTTFLIWQNSLSNIAQWSMSWFMLIKLTNKLSLGKKKSLEKVFLNSKVRVKYLEHLVWSKLLELFSLKNCTTRYSYNTSNMMSTASDWCYCSLIARPGLAPVLLSFVLAINRR